MDVERKLYIGVVEENIDPKKQGRIKVRVQTLYHEISVDDIPWAAPFGSLAGKSFEVPAIGKLVNVMFFQNDLYDPYYMYSENYNINLQNKLNNLSNDEYINFVSLLFDERTQIYSSDSNLTLDYLYNKITIDSTSINLELKDNNGKVNIGCNEETNKKVIYLPNFYPIDTNKELKTLNQDKDTIDICCFGAIRPLKNQLIQATSSIEFANRVGKKLRYHINSTRHETNGLPVYNNIKALFMELNDERYTLVEHNWKNKEEFLLLCSQMDIGIQVSFSETFNIVGCDLLSQGVPVIFSNDIPWSKTKYNANPTDSLDIVDKLLLTYDNSLDNVKTNISLLKEFTDETVNVWLSFFK